MNDDQKLSALNQSETAAPYHLINTALNLPGSTDPNLRGRNADFFTISKCYCGSDHTGYCRTEKIEYLDHHFNLGTAMAISAAGDETEYIRAYRRKNSTFPHQTTADQFFDETQFECYRALGEHIALDALDNKKEPVVSNYKIDPQTKGGKK